MPPPVRTHAHALPFREPNGTRRGRAFTLVELIVVVLVIGVLAAVVVVGYPKIMGRAQEARVVADLRQVATAVAADMALTQSETLSRESVLQVMSEAAGTVTPALSAAGWELGGSADTPARSGQFAVGFDEFDSEVVDTSGSRAAIVASTDGGDLFGVVLTAKADVSAPVAIPDGTTPADVLGAIPAGGSVPVFGENGESPLPEVPEEPEVPAVTAPLDVRAVAGDTVADVTWSAVPKAVRYTVTATPASGSSTVAVDAAGDATSSRVTGLSNGTTYLVAVVAHGADGRASVSEPVSATPVSATAKVLAADGVKSDGFGSSIAVDGDVAVIGAYVAGGDVSEAGAAYVFTRTSSGWAQQAKLVAGDRVARAYFGKSVDVDGDTILVGAYGAGGAAYVFTHTVDGWTQQAKLTGADTTAGFYFGFGVALDGDTAVVGAYGAGSPSGSGAAYVFQRAGSAWSQQAKLVASDRASSDNFGMSVDVDGDTVAVGAYMDDDKGANSGSAYVFARSGSSWSQRAKLVAADGAAGDYFGYTIALDADTLVVSAYMDDDRGVNSGSAYVFTRSAGSWSQNAKLLADDGASGDYFGYSVAIDDGRAVVGSLNRKEQEVAAGGAYVFELAGTSWVHRLTLTAPDGAAGDWFGRAVGISGPTVVVGAERDDDQGENSGAAWMMPVR